MWGERFGESQEPRTSERPRTQDELSYLCLRISLFRHLGQFRRSDLRGFTGLRTLRGGETRAGRDHFETEMSEEEGYSRLLCVYLRDNGIENPYGSLPEYPKHPPASIYRLGNSLP